MELVWYATDVLAKFCLRGGEDTTGVLAMFCLRGGEDNDVIEVDDDVW
jgi:hypothetical protein